MSVLITGTEGFVGKHLTEMFRANKQDILAPTRAEIDLTNDLAVESYFKHNPIEAIVHCATTLRTGTSYPPNTCENNLRMFFNLQRQLTPGMKLINLGSGSEYCRRYWYRKMTESFFDTHVPEDGHSYAKYLISKFISASHNQRMVNLRLFGIFGHHEDYRYKFISNSVVKNLLGMPIVINQNVVYDYLYIADFYRIVKHFVDHPARFREYNVTPTASIDLETIAALINRSSDIQSEILLLNPGIGVECSGDNSRLLEEMGDLQFTPPETAISELLKYYKEMHESLDVEALRQDAFLDYAKSLHKEYFRR
jgi:GDP-L-fucose synthase